MEIPELGIRMSRPVRPRSVPVEPWSAEVPALYRGTLRSAGEAVELAIGFRRVEIRDGVFTVNGRAVTFRGVNRHEHHPDTGRTLDRETMIQDIVMMKRANIDAVRTSHYPPHPEFLRLCDEYGLWVVVEFDLETHGFIYEGWEDNPPAIRRGARRCSIACGAPSSATRTTRASSSGRWRTRAGPAALREMGRWLRERDPSRPVLYERDPSYRNSDFYSLMYPSLELLEQIGRREEPAPDGIAAAEDDRRRGCPSCSSSTRTRWATGPARCRTTGAS